MTESILIYLLLTVLAGFAVTIQAPISNSLGRATSLHFSVLWSFLGGTIAIIIYLVITKTPLPTISTLKSIPLYYYLGAFTGLTFVIITIAVVPHLGVGRMTVILIFAQIVTSLLIDHFGLLGVEVKSIDINKVIGAVLMFGGVYLISK